MNTAISKPGSWHIALHVHDFMHRHPGLTRREAVKIITQAATMFESRRQGPDYERLITLAKAAASEARKAAALNEVIAANNLTAAANTLYYRAEEIIGFGPRATGFEAELDRRANILALRQKCHNSV